MVTNVLNVAILPKLTLKCRSYAASALNRVTDGQIRIAYTIHTPQDARSQSRTPLLLVGGWCMARSDWGEEFTRRLASRRPVVTFDSRGVGQSDCPDGPYSVNMLANDCLSVLRHAGLSAAGILGVSMGGMIAQLVAKNNPDAVKALVLGCTTHGGREALPPPKEFFQVFAQWEGAAAAEKRAMALRSLATMLGSGWCESHTARLHDMAHAYVEETRLSAGINGQLAALGRFNSLPYVRELGAPTLVVHGEEDQVLPFGNGVLLAEKIPNAKMLALPRCGHMWWVCAAVESADAVESFLNDIDQ